MTVSQFKNAAIAIISYPQGNALSTANIELSKKQLFTYMVVV